MNVRKFIAANARDALRKVKETLGNDAIILSNRGIPGGVEIMAVAARDMAMIVPTQVADSTPIERRPQPFDNGDDYRVSLSAARALSVQPVQRHAIPQAAPAPAPAQQVRPAPQFAQPARNTGTVNAGIPRTGSLRNLEVGRPLAASVPPAPQVKAQAQPAPAPRPQPSAPPKRA